MWYLNKGGLYEFRRQPTLTLCAMNGIEKAFADYFKPWSPVLPEAVTAEEEPGVFVGQGWHIRYVFGSDEQGEYLDFLGSHRMTNQRHVRLRAGGEVEGLPTIREMFVYGGTEEDRQRAEAEYFAYNRQVGEMLREKGLMD